MNVTTLITSDNGGSAASQAPIQSSDVFGAVLASLEGAPASEQAPTDPVKVEATGDKIALLGSPMDAIILKDLRQEAVAADVVSIEAGSTNDNVEIQKVWSTAEELVDFEGAEPNGRSPGRADAQEPDGAKDEESSVADEVGSTAVAPLPTPMQVAVPIAHERKQMELPSEAKGEVEADAPPIALVQTSHNLVDRSPTKPSMIHGLISKADETLARRVDGRAEDRKSVAVSLADPVWARQAQEAATSEPVIEAEMKADAVLPASRSHEPAEAPKAVTRAVEVKTGASEAVVHATKVLHAIDVIGEIAEIEPVEGEIDTSEARPAAKLEQIEIEVASDRPTKAVERSAGPTNLGKPVLSMLTQEMLQTSVTDRGDGVPVNIAAGAVQGVAPSSPVTMTQAPLQAHQAVQAHHSTLATSPHRIAPDVGLEIAREASAGKSELSIRLDPAELGRIDIRMSFSEDGRMRAVIAADNPSTFDLLKRDSDTLVRTLAEAGVKTDASDLRFDMRQGGQNADHQSRSGPFKTEHTERGSDDAASDTTKLGRTTRGRLV